MSRKKPTRPPVLAFELENFNRQINNRYLPLAPTHQIDGDDDVDPTTSPQIPPDKHLFLPSTVHFALCPHCFDPRPGALKPHRNQQHQQPFTSESYCCADCNTTLTPTRLKTVLLLAHAVRKAAHTHTLALANMNQQPTTDIADSIQSNLMRSLEDQQAQIHANAARITRMEQTIKDQAERQQNQLQTMHISMTDQMNTILQHLQPHNTHNSTPAPSGASTRTETQLATRLTEPLTPEPPTTNHPDVLEKEQRRERARATRQNQQAPHISEPQTRTQTHTQIANRTTRATRPNTRYTERPTNNVQHPDTTATSAMDELQAFLSEPSRPPAQRDIRPFVSNYFEMQHSKPLGKLQYLLTSIGLKGNRRAMRGLSYHSLKPCIVEVVNEDDCTEELIKTMQARCQARHLNQFDPTRPLSMADYANFEPGDVAHRNHLCHLAKRWERNGCNVPHQITREWYRNQLRQLVQRFPALPGEMKANQDREPPATPVTTTENGQTQFRAEGRFPFVWDTPPPMQDASVLPPNPTTGPTSHGQMRISELINETANQTTPTQQTACEQSNHDPQLSA